MLNGFVFHCQLFALAHSMDLLSVAVASLMMAFQMFIFRVTSAGAEGS